MQDLYADLYGDGDELYEIVLNGDWTLDKMIELVDGAYVDTDGNGEADTATNYREKK